MPLNARACIAEALGTYLPVFGGTGASMNPARSLGPALVSGNLQHFWIYLIAPLAGASLAVGSWKIIKAE